jgi:PAS domain S-box-containing protein
MAPAMSLLLLANRVRNQVWPGYVLAVALSLLALLVRFELAGMLTGYPFLTFFAAVFLVAFFGGTIPALLTVAITALMADYYLIQPTGTLAMAMPSGAIALGLYFLITGTVIALIRALTRAQERQALSEEALRQQALFATEQRFRILVQGVRDYAIYMLDPQGHVSNWNSGAALIKGYSAEEIVGQHFSRFYTEADRASGEPQRALATALAEGKYEREARRVRKDGSLFWASVVIDPIYDESGEHIGFAKITRDISERKEREVELEQARETIAQAQKLKTLGEFTGGIAHDFNNLMTVVVGSSDFLLKHPDLPAEKRRKYLESIAQTADRATNLTNHLLAFARRQSLRPEVVDLRTRLDAFGEMLSRLLGSRIAVTITNEADDPLVEVDASQLDTALLNAAINARDAMPDGGELKLATSNCELHDEPAVCITITDTGVGIPREELSRVFEPFFTTKETGKGTGLGLSQLHGFAAQAGGDAEIESEPGTGTTLRIRLPRTNKQTVPAAPSRPLAELPTGLCILVVEDNVDVQQFATKLLQDMGCEVVAVTDGAQAMEKLRDARFDLVFSDVMMPNMGGLELAGAMRREHVETPLVLTSGYSDELIGAVPRETVVVRKPYDVTGLQEAIIAALGIGTPA